MPILKQIISFHGHLRHTAICQTTFWNPLHYVSNAILQTTCLGALLRYCEWVPVWKKYHKNVNQPPEFFMWASPPGSSDPVLKEYSLRCVSGCYWSEFGPKDNDRTNIQQLQQLKGDTVDIWLVLDTNIRSYIGSPTTLLNLPLSDPERIQCHAVKCFVLSESSYTMCH